MNNNLSELERDNGELHEDSFNTINDICSITNPKRILEIGFNRGTSSIYWLQNSKALVTSIDIRPYKDVQTSISYIKEKYPGRFEYIEMDSRKLQSSFWHNKFDLCFIDGDHTIRGVNIDVNKCIEMNIRYLTFDDYFHGSHSKDIQNIIKYKNAVNAVLNTTKEFEEKAATPIERVKNIIEYNRMIDTKIKNEAAANKSNSNLQIIKEYNTGSGQVLVENKLCNTL
tara:strand:+ start:659 stop:1339 length:681 start_codon:yes stop_codon:yes gene_type:complete